MTDGKRRNVPAIHTDFEKDLLRAEVISHDDFTTHKSKLPAAMPENCASKEREYIVKMVM